MEYQLVRMSITYNLSLDLVCIIISQITHESWKLVSTELKEKIYNMVEVCNNPLSFGNHANITQLLYILSCTMLCLSSSYGSQSCIYYTLIVYYELYYVVTILQL